MPEIFWWIIIGLLHIVSLLAIPAIPLAVWVLWAMNRQDAHLEFQKSQSNSWRIWKKCAARFNKSSVKEKANEQDSKDA